MSTDAAVLLDAGGVLVLPDFDVVREELASVGLSPEISRFERAHYIGMRAVDKAEKFSWWTYNHAFVDEIGITDDVERAREAVNRAYVRMEWHRPIADSMDALKQLGPKVAIVSNSDGTVENILRRRGVTVPIIIDSHHVGVAKPDRAIFDLALEKLGVDRTRAIHVGDSVRFDVKGADAAGIRGLHFDPFSVCDDPSHTHIASLSEMVG